MARHGGEGKMTELQTQYSQLANVKTTQRHKRTATNQRMTIQLARAQHDMKAEAHQNSTTPEQRRAQAAILVCADGAVMEKA